jgi:two-component system, sensor histidine kinase and response regulator
MSRRPVILCVDDEKIVLDSIKEQLRRHFQDQFSVETVDSGEEALELIDELLSDGLQVPVVVSDHIMPGMKGSELLAKIHDEYPRILTILLTGQADGNAVGYAVNSASLYRYIAKPWDEEDLIQTLREASRSYFQDRKLEQQNRELESRQAVLTRLVAGVAHEVNTPLGAIRSSADTISRALDRSAQQVDASTAERLAKAGALLSLVSQGSERIGRIVEQLKRFVSLDEAERKIVDVRDSVQNAAYLVTASHAGEILVELDLDEAPCPVDCYPARIGDALLHLLQNAANAMSGKGAIQIEVTSTDGSITTTISDRGCGISEDRLPTLFEPDFANKDGASRVGLGMGLAIARRTIEEAGGQLQLQSKVNEGTRAIVQLPVSSA